MPSARLNSSSGTALLARRVMALAVGPWEPDLIRTLVRLGPRDGDEVVLVLPDLQGPLRESVARWAGEVRYVVQRLGEGSDLSEVVVRPGHVEESVVELVARFTWARAEGATVVGVPGSSPVATTALLLAVALSGGSIALPPGTTGCWTIELPRLAPDVGGEKAAILSLVDAGASPRDIARQLGVNPSTVYRHISSMREMGLLSASREVGLVGRAVLVQIGARGRGRASAAGARAGLEGDS